MWSEVGAAVMLTFLAAVAQPQINSYDPAYGVYLGELADSELQLSGKLYVVNATTFQLINFTYSAPANVETFFWVEPVDQQKDGVKLATRKFGVTPLGEYRDVDRVVLQVPSNKNVSSYRNFGIYSLTDKTYLTSLPIPSDVLIPKAEFLSKELTGSRYSVGSGPILIQDRRTIKIFAFTFDGAKAPDGYFFVGRGVNVVHDAGVKVPIRGRDHADNVTAMNQRYRGGEDIVLELPPDHDVNHIDWLAVYCYKYKVDLSHVVIGDLSQYILPPFVPVDDVQPEQEGAWKLQQLLGSPTRTNFTLQLGPPGGRFGYEGITGLRPASAVWYVNGYLAEIYLKRGFNYTFIVEGGSNSSFYISDDRFGGINLLSDEEKAKVKIFAPQKAGLSSEKLCRWDSEVDDADSYESFADYRKSLHLSCYHIEEPAALLSFLPDKSTPDVLYGNIASEYNAGFRINVVDEFPEDIPDIQEPPFESDAWINRTNSAFATVSSMFVMLTGVLLAWNW